MTSKTLKGVRIVASLLMLAVLWGVQELMADNINFDLAKYLTKNGRVLDLRETAVSDADLSQLSQEKYSKVNEISLWSTNVGDGGLEHLKHLPLVQAKLSNTRVTDSGVRYLADLPNLQLLYLANNEITDAGLREVSKIKKLNALNLAETKITDSGLAYLKDLPIEWLDLSGTKITDVGLVHLKRLKLKGLAIVDTKITDGAINDFKANVPGVGIGK